MAEKEKTSLYLLGIVGIVAVVGIVVLMLSDVPSESVVAEKESVVGQAIGLKPDLVITDADVYIERKTHPPDILHIVVTIKNQGREATKTPYFSNGVMLTYAVTSPYYVTHYMTDPEEAATVKGTIAAGGSTKADLTYWLEPEPMENLDRGKSHTFTFIISVDDTNEIKESIEFNNVYSDTVTLTLADVT